MKLHPVLKQSDAVKACSAAGLGFLECTIVKERGQSVLVVLCSVGNPESARVALVDAGYAEPMKVTQSLRPRSLRGRGESHMLVVRWAVGRPGERLPSVLRETPTMPAALRRQREESQNGG